MWLARAAAAASVAAAAFVVAGPAFAAPSIDTTVPTSTFSASCAAGINANRLCMTDNASVSYYMDSSGEYELESGDRANVNSAMSRYNATDLTTSYDSSPVFSGVGETDVVHQEGSTGLPSGAIGITWCQDPVDGDNYRCDQAYIRIRGNGAITEVSAGHETGHAMGETHGAQAAPVQGQCAGAMGIMRAAADCLSNPALGSNIIANLNWVY